jgi:alpha-1,3-rhamnosyl/mannosyltransferase
VTLHDLFFLEHPDLTHAEIRRDYSPLVREHTRRADGIICVSEHTASEAVRLLDLPREKLTVIPNGVDPIYRSQPAPEEVDQLLTRLRLPLGGFLYVGSTEPRKNLKNLVAGHDDLARRRPDTPPLILVGPDARWASEHGLDARATRAIGYLERVEVRALMAASRALVMPSLQEGFGLPVAEAMAAGLPVVCSRGSALEEVAGEAACFIDPLDPASIALAMEGLLDEPSRAHELRQKGLARSQAFDWDRATAQTLDLYQRVLES